MKPVPNPCRKDCPDRSITCHGECRKYALFRAYNIIQYKQRALDKDCNLSQAESVGKVLHDNNVHRRR